MNTDDSLCHCRVRNGVYVDEKLVETFSLDPQRIVLYVDKMYVAHRVWEKVCVEQVVYQTAPGRAAKIYNIPPCVKYVASLIMYKL